MEEDQELGFACRFCSKRFPCGKSLGGHIRSHMTGNSSESDEKLERNVTKVSSQNCEDSKYSAYCLRGNPKKTWRFVNSKAAASQKEQVCKQCGKGFQSVKALCGHMACHSEKDRVLKDDYDCSWTTENHKLVMDSHSDTEAEAPRRPQRPKRAAASMRYKRAVVTKSSLANGSSSVSDIDHEQEEVAMWLMMLSRDSGKWVGVNSVAESSDNNSVVLETKSYSSEMRIGRDRSSFNCVYDGVGTVGNKNLVKGKLKSSGLDVETVNSENSDSRYFMDEPKKVDSGVSVAIFPINDKFKKKKVNCGSRFEVSVSDMEQHFSNVKCMGARLKKHFYMEKPHGESVIASNSTKNNPRKRTANGFYGPDFRGKSCKKLLQGYSEAAGGNECESGREKKETVEGLSSNGERRSKQARNRKHECPICHKIYKSGQALGGHKRSHFLGGSKEKFDQTPVVKQELVSDLLDLNLPAPVDDNSNGNSQFNPW
ncbi:uncharacterized protein LOC127796438 [Diospyros lotus]|uniref:uncharacterized protein LOC127796438 n=1 Tax=Diospyros lotus TaxID=55363 RepID=UPI00224E3A02|nr:uncharacterized protein LOC127796438 [Diospyros lotus]